jgi:chromosomal replication initiator protein
VDNFINRTYMANKDANEIWNGCLESIKVSVSSAAFSAWFARTRLSSLEKVGERYQVEIACPTSYIKNYLENRYFGLIQDSLNKALRGSCTLTFIVKDIVQKETENLGGAPLFTNYENNSHTYKNAINASRLRTNFVFSNFAVSPSNQMAYAAAEAVAKSPGEAYNPLFIWGGVGVGKTHLMCSVGHEVIKNTPDKKVYFCTGEEFTNDIVEGIRNRTTQSFRNKYRKLDVLMIDDIQFIAGKESVQQEFFHTFNAVVSSGGQILLTSDKPPQEISKLEERLKSRFEAGLIVDIAPPDFELRCAITLIKAKEKNLDIPMNIIQLIAANLDAARKIQGFLVKLSSELTIKPGSQINEEMIQSLLGKKLADEELVKKVAPEKVIDSICKYFDIGKRSILSDSRLKKFAFPRQILMYLLRVELKFQLAEVGRIVSGRDHTTVMHAVDKVSHLVSTDVGIRGDIDNIKKLIWG